MKREIQFRGKRYISGEWVYGDLMRYEGNTYIWANDTSEPYNSRMVDPDTVGQYTGLTDQNGTKIFEGDIVGFEDAAADHEGYHDNVFFNRAVIEYDEYGWAICGDISTVTMDDLVYKGEFDGEVIGNRWDNP